MGSIPISHPSKVLANRRGFCYALGIIHSSLTRMHEGMGGMCGMCKCPHHKIFPLCVTLIGLAFLLQALGLMAASTVAVAWPVLLIIIGLMKMSSGMCKCCAEHKKM